MEKEKLESLLIDFIDNKLNAVDRQKVEQELVSNADAYKLYEQLKEVMHAMDRSAYLEPGANLKRRFDEQLLQEIASSKKARTIFFQPSFYRVAAAVAFLVVATGVGFWIKKQNDEIARIKLEMEENRKLVAATQNMLAMLHNDQSASKRMMGVKAALDIGKADDQIVSALVKTMNEDPSSNVRLAALDALSNFIGEAHVRNAIIGSLAVQKDPVVQIALIQLLVKMKEKGVVEDLQKIVDDESNIKAVKDEAYSGILKLS